MKHFSRFSLTSFLLFFFSVASVSAALPQTFNNVLRIIAEPLQVLFVVVPKSSAFPLLLKFLYFIILAALWSGIASEITKNREAAVKRAFKLFGVIVALISAIFIPQSWLLYAFKLPAMISVVLFFLVVPLGGYFLCHRLIPGDSTAARLGRAFIWWILALLVLGLVEFIQTHPDPALQQIISPVLDALNIAAVVALFAGLYNFAMGLGAGRAAEAARDAIRGGTTPPETTTPPGPAPGPRPVPNHDTQSTEDGHPRIRNLLAQLQQKVNELVECVNQYNTITNELIEKIRKKLSADAGYFEAEPIDFDWRTYHDLIEKISSLEQECIRLIEQINHEQGWQGTPDEENAKILILKFEETVQTRRRIKEAFYEYLPHLNE